MESGQFVDVSMHQPLLTPRNEKNQVGNHNDIMTRRLKNRERQRRYRARKRLEAETRRVRTSLLLQHHAADIMKAHTSVPVPQDTQVVSKRKKAGDQGQLAPVATEMAVNGTVQDFASRVHCRRDWKKDARRVHLNKDQAVQSKDHFNPEQTAVGGNHLPLFSFGINVDTTSVNRVQLSAPHLDNNGTRRAVPGRRHWKAEARNKKN